MELSLHIEHITNKGNFVFHFPYFRCQTTYYRNKPTALRLYVIISLQTNRIRNCGIMYQYLFLSDMFFISLSDKLSEALSYVDICIIFTDIFIYIFIQKYRHIICYYDNIFLLKQLTIKNIFKNSFTYGHFSIHKYMQYIYN